MHTSDIIICSCRGENGCWYIGSDQVHIQADTRYLPSVCEFRFGYHLDIGQIRYKCLAQCVCVCIYILHTGKMYLICYLRDSQVAHLKSLIFQLKCNIWSVHDNQCVLKHSWTKDNKCMPSFTHASNGCKTNGFSVI